MGIKLLSLLHFFCSVISMHGGSLPVEAVSSSPIAGMRPVNPIYCVVLSDGEVSSTDSLILELQPMSSAPMYNFPVLVIPS